MQCTKCGRDAPAESVFCSFCGTQLVGPTFAIEESNFTPQSLKSTVEGRGAAPREEELWAGTYSPKAMMGTMLAAAIITLVGLVVAMIGGPLAWMAFVVGALVLWGGIGLLVWYRRLTVRYRLTTFRFFHDSGLLTRVGNRIEVIDIDDVMVYQGLIERMFGVGTISIQSSDTSHPELSLPGIENAKAVADLIDGTRRAERHRRGMFMENV